jgi:hypothetical protein
MNATHNHQGILSSPLSKGNEEEERMIERVHGIDRHKQFSTISVLNRQGEEVQFQGACREFGKYVEDLGPTDAVVLEASTGSFWWADQIEAKGAKCFVNECRGVPWPRIRGSFASSRIRGTRRTSTMHAIWRRRCGCTW